MKTYYLTLQIAILVAACISMAQTEDSADLSYREIAAVIASGYIGSVPVTTEVFLGAPPDKEPPCSLGQSEVLGGFSQSGSSTWIYRVRAPGGAARDDCHSQFSAAGWTTTGSDEGGLRDPAESVSLCTSDEFVSLGVANSNGRTYLLVRSTGFDGRCQAGSRFVSAAEVLPIDIPVLTPPERAITQSSGGGYSGSTSYHGSQTVSLGGTPTELIRHYRPQFSKQGWTFVEESELEKVAILVFRKPDESGTPWTAELIAVQHDFNVQVYLYMNAERAN